MGVRFTLIAQPIPGSTSAVHRDLRRIILVTTGGVVQYTCCGYDGCGGSGSGGIMRINALLPARDDWPFVLGLPGTAATASTARHRQRRRGWHGRCITPRVTMRISFGGSGEKITAAHRDTRGTILVVAGRVVQRLMWRRWLW